MKPPLIVTERGQRKVDRLNWIDFYGIRIYDENGFQAQQQHALHQDANTDGFEELKARIETVADALQTIVDDDMDHRATYSLPDTDFRSKRKLSGVAILGDCGLPRIDTLAVAAKQFAESFRGTKSLIFTGVGMEAVGSVLPKSKMRFSALPGFLGVIYKLLNFRLASLFVTKPKEFDGNQLEYLNLITSLTSMDWQRSSAWTFGLSETWQEQLGQDLTVYLSDLFSGNFVDRNGTKTSFDIGVDLTDFSRYDDLQISPQVAGKIVVVLIEFLFDVLLPVPFYSETILGKYRDYRAAEPKIRAHTEDELQDLVDAGASIRASEKLHFLKYALNNGELSELIAGVLGIPIDAVQKFDWETQLGDSTTLSDDWSRVARDRLVSVDAENVSMLLTRQSLNRQLDAIVAGKSPYQKSFTCFRGRTIRSHLHCIFIDHPVGMNGDLVDPTWFDNAEKTGNCTREGAIGATKSGTVDYSDLVGKVIRFVGKTTEKNARSVAGGLVRGVSIASLDNEVVAEVIATAFATTWRKTAEWATFQVLVWWITDPSSYAGDKTTRLNAIAELLGFLEDED